MAAEKKPVFIQSGNIRRAQSPGEVDVAAIGRMLAGAPRRGNSTVAITESMIPVDPTHRIDVKFDEGGNGHIDTH